MDLNDRLIDLDLGSDTDPIMESLPKIREILYLLYEQTTQRPYPEFQPPDDLYLLSDQEVAHALMCVVYIESHYRTLEEQLDVLARHIKDRLDVFHSWLCDNVYNEELKSERKEKSKLDRDYLTASNELLRAERLLAFLRAQHAQWSLCYKGLSRAIELRKGYQWSGNDSGGKTPHRNPR